MTAAALLPLLPWPLPVWMPPLLLPAAALPCCPAPPSTTHAAPLPRPPAEWWDNRTNKRNPKAPDFKKKGGSDGEPSWVAAGWQRVQAALAGSRAWLVRIWLLRLAFPLPKAMAAARS